MLKNHHKLKKSCVVPGAVTRLTAAGLLFSFFSGIAGAQPLPVSSFGFAPLPAHQAEAATYSLTLQEAVALALGGNPDLAVSKREIEAMQGQVLQAQMRPNPELTYSMEDQRVQTRTQSVQISLPVELGGKRAARIAAAEQGRNVAYEGLNVRRLEIRAAVVSTFFETLIAQERVLLAQGGVVLARKATEAVIKRVAAGKISPVEEVKARVAEAAVRVELAQILGEQRSAKGRLVALLGSNSPQFEAVSGSVGLFPLVPSAESLRQRMLDTPVLRLAAVEVDRRKTLTDIERAKQTPDITLSLGVKRPNDLRRDQLLFGVSVPLPLFDRNQGGLLEAVKREEKARDELQALTVRVHTEATQARERLDVLRSEVELLQRDVLPGASGAYDAATRGFEHGKFNFLEVLDAQRTYFSAKSQYLKAVGDAHRVASDIDRLLGDDSLKMAKTINEE